jgi:hypothetical protein
MANAPTSCFNRVIIQLLLPSLNRVLDWFANKTTKQNKTSKQFIEQNVVVVCEQNKSILQKYSPERLLPRSFKEKQWKGLYLNMKNK